MNCQKIANTLEHISTPRNVKLSFQHSLLLLRYILSKKWERLSKFTVLTASRRYLILLLVLQHHSLAFTPNYSMVCLSYVQYSNPSLLSIRLNVEEEGGKVREHKNLPDGSNYF